MEIIGKQAHKTDSSRSNLENVKTEVPLIQISYKCHERESRKSSLPHSIDGLSLE
jgi:hypothetical protein